MLYGNLDRCDVSLRMAEKHDEIQLILNVVANKINPTKQNTFWQI